ncbi:unnamed protein product [Symbiodinium necroappetens]|uniref:Uncharacterized protein n=1 Tax=Symbiodinium necroappetens TaxID=1628268 RepID=A0A813BUK3_9DINO|nr:unnamed protein product [Symbiodinium necroappetens]
MSMMPQQAGMPFGQMPGQQPLGAAPLPDGGAPEAPQKRIIIRRNSTRKEASASPELASRDEPLGAAMPVVEPRGDREPPALPPPLADGTRQVLVMIPRPTTASSDGFGLDDESVKIPEFGVTIDLPDWYREAQNELRRPPPSWPPQVLIDVGADLQDDGEAGQDEHSGLRRGSKASHDTKSSADTTATGEGKKLSPLQAAIQARQRAAETTADDEKDEKASEAGSPSASKRRASVAQLRKSKLFPYILVVLFSNHVYTSGLKTIRDWASKMQTHFEDTCQMQMRNCISWLARALRTFARTLMVDSHRGLELAPSRGSGLKILDIGGDDLTSRQRLAIRAYVLFDILLTGVETPPPPLTRFLSRLAQPEGIMLYIPKTYFTESERTALDYDPRGGCYSQPRSRQHQQLVAGFLIPRALLGGLFTSWIRTLDGDPGVGADRSKRNLQTLGALIYLGFQKQYDLLGGVHDIPGLSTATSERLTQFGLDKRLVNEVGELVEKLVVFFTQPDAHMSIVQRVESNPFTAGRIKIAPRERQGEGAEMAVQADDVPDDEAPAPMTGSGARMQYFEHSSMLGTGVLCIRLYRTVEVGHALGNPSLQNGRILNKVRCVLLFVFSGTPSFAAEEHRAAPSLPVERSHAAAGVGILDVGFFFVQVDRLKSFAPSVSEAASSVKSGAGRFRQSLWEIQHLSSLHDEGCPAKVQISEEPEDSHLKWAHVCLLRVNGHSCARLLQMTEPDKSKVLHLQEGGSG